jgi:hypothetical protein
LIEGKGLGNKNINRINLRLSNSYDLKLKQLSRSVNKKPAELTRYIVEYFLDNAQFVFELQDKFCLYDAYRVTPVRANSEVKYQLNGGRYDQ